FIGAPHFVGRECPRCYNARRALVVEVVDTRDLGSSAERRGGSSPSWRTISIFGDVRQGSLTIKKIFKIKSLHWFFVRFRSSKIVASRAFFGVAWGQLQSLP